MPHESISGTGKMLDAKKEPDPDEVLDASPICSASTSSSFQDSCQLKYREQEYLSTSASESDYTSDDGDATDAETELEGENEGDGNKRHFLAHVTVTVDSQDESSCEKDDKEGPEDGDRNTLTH